MFIHKEYLEIEFDKYFYFLKINSLKSGRVLNINIQIVVHFLFYKCRIEKIQLFENRYNLATIIKYPDDHIIFIFSLNKVISVSCKDIRVLMSNCIVYIYIKNG